MFKLNECERRKSRGQKKSLRTYSLLSYSFTDKNWCRQEIKRFAAIYAYYFVHGSCETFSTAFLSFQFVCPFRAPWNSFHLAEPGFVNGLDVARHVSDSYIVVQEWTGADKSAHRIMSDRTKAGSKEWCPWEQWNRTISSDYSCVVAESDFALVITKWVPDIDLTLLTLAKRTNASATVNA